MHRIWYVGLRSYFSKIRINTNDISYYRKNIFFYILFHTPGILSKCIKHITFYFLVNSICAYSRDLRIIQEFRNMPLGRVTVCLYRGCRKPWLMQTSRTSSYQPEVRPERIKHIIGEDSRKAAIWNVPYQCLCQKYLIYARLYWW